MIHFPQRLTIARNKAGLTQGDLAEKIGVKSGKQTIYNWEKGTREPSMSQLIQLAQVLDVSVVWLIEGGEESLPKSSPAVQESPVGYVTVPAEEYIDLQRRLIKQQQEQLDQK